MSRSDWLFNEFKHIGVDFADPEQVKSYDARQHSNVEREKPLVQRLNIQPGDTVVEFGPGTGAFSIAAALAGAQVIAVDISRAMLDYAQSKAKEAGLSDIRFVNSGFLSYEHQAEPADFVVSAFALHHLPDFWKGVALRRIFDLLKPGGIFYLQDVVFSFETGQYEQRLNEWMDVVSSNTGNGFSRADFEMHIREEYSTFGWILEGLLQREGFSIPEANYFTPTKAEYVCQAIRKI
jgi:ubiquinone/menaquinone biosynthesis C-methylase UbiE